MKRRPWWVYRRVEAAEARAEAESKARRRADHWKPLPDKIHKRLKPVLMLMDAKRYGEAKEAVADFLEKNPKHKAGLALLIRIHGKLEEIGLAEHLFDYAMRTRMECKSVYSAMVDAYASCREFSKALQVMAEAETRGMGDAESYVYLMAGLYSEARYEDIEKLYKTIPMKYRIRPSIIVKYADALRKRRQYGKAVETATLAMSMPGTLGERVAARIVIAYSEIARGNPEKAYEVLCEVYKRISGREDSGLSFRFFPRLLCGMVFACSGGMIPQPYSTIAHWKRMLETIRDEGRGKEADIRNALMCLQQIPVLPIQQAL